MARFTAAITSWGHSRTRNLCDRFGRGLAKSDSMALSSAVGTLQFTARTVVVKRALGTLRQVSTVSLRWGWSSWCGWGGGSMDRHNLLILGGGLSFLAFLLIPSFPFSIR